MVRVDTSSGAQKVLLGWSDDGRFLFVWGSYGAETKRESRTEVWALDNFLPKQ